MKSIKNTNYLLKQSLLGFLLFVGLGMLFPNTGTAQITTDCFGFTGAEQTFVVPPGVTSITIEAYGAQGGDGEFFGDIGIGGEGGFASGDLAVTPGEVLYIYVGGEGQQISGANVYGGGGFNGGGDAHDENNGGGRGGGGGASDVRQGANDLGSRVIVAGGGGGACCSGPGGCGGGLTGEDGQSAFGANGFGGTQVGGGSGYGGCGGSPVMDGSLGQGGSVPVGCINTVAGGGGGFFGGGAGLGGGGGSSYIGGVTNGVTSLCGQEGEGEVCISYSAVLCDVAITSVVTSAAPTCGNSGTIDIVAVSSNPPISYSISGPVNMTNGTGSFSGLPAGTYIITVTDQGSPPPCQATETVSLIGDITPPVIVCPPPIFGLACGPAPAAAIDGLDFIAQGGAIVDDCTAPEDVIVVVQESTAGDFCPNGDPFILTRTYLIIDEAGNVSTCTQDLNFLESAVGPVITSVEPNCTKYCSSQFNPQPTDITYTTDCAFGATVDVSGPVAIGTPDCPGYFEIYTYTVTDDCDRTASVQRTFFVDNSGPEITCPPTNLILECGDPNNQDYVDAHLAIASATASCGLGVNLS